MNLNLSTKREFFLYGTVAILFILSLTAHFIISNLTPQNPVAEIYENGVLIGIYGLENELVNLNLDDRFEVQNGKIRVSYANCPDKICVNTGFIPNGIIPIICIPNKLEIRITSGLNSNNSAELDAIVK
ncbi:MAG: NusG domain II-containing protein [Oscillospiraceae bacterium]|nr:NusG domain II-containing protein [Oscillospiraceae bacterium]